METLIFAPNGTHRPDGATVRSATYPNLMKEKSKAVLWVCFTLLVASGMKYVPVYLLQQRQLDLQERTLDLKEDAFLHQKVAPTVSAPQEGVRENRSQLL